MVCDAPLLLVRPIKGRRRHLYFLVKQVRKVRWAKPFWDLDLVDITGQTAVNVCGHQLLICKLILAPLPTKVAAATGQRRLAGNVA